MIITLTTTKNQKDNEKNSNVSTVNLGECENVLRKKLHSMTLHLTMRLNLQAM